MIDIKNAGIDDAVLISALGAKSFFDAFGEHTKKEDIEYYISGKFSTEHIKEEISNPLSNFFIAYFNHKPAGYAKLINSPMPGEISTLNAIEMQRIYVLKEYYSMKIGKAMMMHTLDFAFSKGYNSMWLGVWQKNNRATEFYKKWGFEIFGTRNFTLGSSINDDYLMIKKF